LVSGKALPTIFWDFEGTLVEGPGWSKTMRRVLDDNLPGHGISHEQIKAFLHEGFPWHNPERPHPELCTPSAWWAFLEAVLARAYQGVGYDTDESERLAKLTHELVLEPNGYTPFEGTIPALKRLSDLGWRHIILSNHIPELPSLIDKLPINGYIRGIICSAITGYEKPHPQAFSIALEHAGHPEKVWMIGDNLLADVRGAEAAGIPAILVHRSSDESVKYQAGNLLEAVSIIENSL